MTRLQVVLLGLSDIKSQNTPTCNMHERIKIPLRGGLHSKLNLHSKITQSYPPSPPLLANLNIPRTTFDIFSGAAHDIQELKCHHVKS